MKLMMDTPISYERVETDIDDHVEDELRVNLELSVTHENENDENENDEDESHENFVTAESTSLPRTDDENEEEESGDDEEESDDEDEGKPFLNSLSM